MRFILGQIYNKLIAYPLVIIFVMQFILICIAFNKIVFHPDAYMFIDFADGLKNYYTLYQYVIQDASPLGPWHFTAMNYPFGEYIFFTDNTPFLALCMRFVNQHLFNIQNHIILIHNYFFLICQLILPIFFFKLFDIKHKSNICLLIILCVGTTWISPQILKLLYGVYNFSIGLLPVFMLFILKDLFQYFNGGVGNKGIIGLKIFALIFFSGLFHLYFVAILALPIGIFLLTMLLTQLFKRKWIQISNIFILCGFLLGGGLLLHLLIGAVDTYASDRLAVAQGFGYTMWRLTPESIFTPYTYSTLIPLFRSCSYKNITGESMSYLGAFFLFTLLIGLVFLIFQIILRRVSIRMLIDKLKSKTFYISLIITSFFVYATASGPYVQFCIIPISFDNWFSVFYFLYKKVDMITQFRCLARFNWPGFWIMSFLGISLFTFLFNKFYNRNKFATFFLFALPLLLVMMSDVRDFIKYQNSIYYPNAFNYKVVEARFKELKIIDFKKYQAIYTIPTVIVGSENYDITLNDQQFWTEYWMQLSIHSHLPLFNCKMSRTAENQAQAQIDILLNKKVDPLILNNINRKKVLVAYWPEGEKNYDVPVQDKARSAAFEGSKIIKAFKMDSITSVEGIQYFEWDIDQNNN